MPTRAHTHVCMPVCVYVITFLFSVFEVSKCFAVSRYYKYNQGGKKSYLKESVIGQDVPKGR